MLVCIYSHAKASWEDETPLCRTSSVKSWLHTSTIILKRISSSGRTFLRHKDSNSTWASGVGGVVELWSEMHALTVDCNGTSSRQRATRHHFVSNFVECRVIDGTAVPKGPLNNIAVSVVIVQHILPPIISTRISRQDSIISGVQLCVRRRPADPCVYLRCSGAASHHLIRSPTNKDTEALSICNCFSWSSNLPVVDIIGRVCTVDGKRTCIITKEKDVNMWTAGDVAVTVSFGEHCSNCCLHAGLPRWLWAHPRPLQSAHAHAAQYRPHRIAILWASVVPFHPRHGEKNHSNGAGDQNICGRARWQTTSTTGARNCIQPSNDQTTINEMSSYRCACLPGTEGLCTRKDHRRNATHHRHCNE